MIKKLGKSNAYMLFGKNGNMQQLERVHLSKGTKIFAFGYGMSEQYFVVSDDDMNAVEICNGNSDAVDKYDLDRYFSPRKKLDDTIRPISQKFGIGFYYDESGEVISDEIIEKSLIRADNLEALKKRMKEEKECKDAEMRAELPKKYPHLEVVKECFDHKTCGKNIRAELKKHFPTTKFSVRYESFSGGDSYDISWTDGPKQSDVDVIVKKFKNMHPDVYSQGDYWDCVPSIFNGLFGSVGYVTTHRCISDDAKQKIREKYSDLTEENKVNYPYELEEERMFAHQHPSWSVDELVIHFARLRDWQTKEEKVPCVTVKVDGLQIVDYSEKSFAVIGNTKEVKDHLKKLGGRFNPRLSCGAGWIFSKKQRAAVEAII